MEPSDAGGPLLFDEETREPSFTVSQLNEQIREVLSMGFPQTVWVCGEIQGYDRNRGKTHVFFDLCEKDPVSKGIVARVGLVIFAGRKRVLREQMNSAGEGFELKDDIEVRFLCRVDFYPPHGALRLIVEGIDPVYTLGRIAQERRRLLIKLDKEGVLQQNKRLALPDVPLNIGLVTAFDSAAYNDFLCELRASGYGFRVRHRSALMQGRGAPADVSAAIAELGRIEGIDVIVVTRGGGAIAELSCFDDESIARAIAASPVPVLSGIGHEINVTIADLAAHTYQKTPTAAARFLVERVAAFVAGLEDRGRMLGDLVRSRLTDERRRLQTTAFAFQHGTQAYLRGHERLLIGRIEAVRRLPRHRLRRHTEAVRSAVGALHAGTMSLLRHRVQVLTGYRETLGRIVPRVLARRREALRLKAEALSHRSAGRFRSLRMQCRRYEDIVRWAHPRNILRRGFSITRDDEGRVVKSVAGLEEGMGVVTEVADGFLESRVAGTRVRAPAAE